MSTATLSSLLSTPKRVSAAAYLVAAVFGIATILSLFVLADAVPLLTPVALAVGALYAWYGASAVWAFVTFDWASPRAKALAALRAASVAGTGALLVFGAFASFEVWACVATGVMVFLLSKVVCGRSGHLDVARRAGQL